MPAAAAAHDPLAQRRPLAGGALAVARVVGGKPLLVGQELLPGDVAGMVILDQHRPLGARQPDRLGHDRAVRADRAARAVPPEHVRAGVAGIGEHVARARVGQPAPAQLARPRAAPGALGEPAVLEHADHPVRRAGLLERPEQVRDRGLHLLVGVDDHAAVLVVEVADRQRQPQLAALGGGALGALQP